MNAYMADLLGDGKSPADAATVNAARTLYWKKYGATLLGLINHHNVNPAEFLQQAHHFDDLPNLLRYESGLKRLLKRLPGRKILFTNAPRQYSRQVLQHLGLHRHFDQHISIESMRVHGKLRPKPSRWLLRKLLAKQKLSARHCVLIEDTRENLRTAKQLGMKTVWITQYLKEKKRFTRAHYIDLKIRSIKQIPTQLSRLSLNK
ncbi:HAD-SF-IA-v3: HAD hydrolase, family IA, variant 3 [Solimicrobium silvestre]|uniref:HAD-SF-IA-v3: HAD hydrolase, family IA, variant 3 n=2 Tax=Solimicrobium silvestre TaxID=2099400 RepID=A0A2S9H3A2_9BURK|nr:HAD-SF-IA-v3: HAD hydrolase, family IA, variant 3 [Solimicrobium silvestre]